MTAERERVITVHGLWMTGIESGMLRHRLREEYGFLPEAFRYYAVAAGLAENARRLRQFVTDRPGEPFHFVGHSLGGLLILQMLADCPDVVARRVVCLGSPIEGSASAAGVAQFPGMRAMLGKSISEAVLEEKKDWRAVLARFDVGMIAGTLSMGLGRFFGELPAPNDGTVAVAETKNSNLADHICVSSSHTGLVVSPLVAQQVAKFLRDGAFDHALMEDDA